MHKWFDSPLKGVKNPIQLSTAKDFYISRKQMLWPRIKVSSTGLGHSGGQFLTSRSSLCSNEVLLIFFSFFMAHISETEQSTGKGILGSTWYWETSERQSLGQRRGACMPRSGGLAPRPAATLLPLRKPPCRQSHGASPTLLTPLFSVGLPSLSGHRKQPAAQAGSRLFLLPKEAMAFLHSLRTQGSVLLGPWGKAFVVKQGLSIPRVKDCLGEDQMREHDSEPFIPPL